MSDTYQAVYDAVRSRVGGCNVGDVVREQARQSFDISHAVAILQQDISAIAYEHQRPSVLFRPRVYPDGAAWCALYGDDIQEGVCGFGDSPAAATEAFDKAWYAKIATKSDSKGATP